MKKTLLAVALTGAFATVAHAQSSVTLYGLLDAGISYSSNVRVAAGQGSGAVAMTSGLMQSDRWGLKGAEDLGGGLKAVFDLEDGFSIGNGKLGQGGREFGRNAYVGLSSNSVGTVTIGRQNEFMYDYVSQMSMENFNGAGGNAFTHVLDNDNMDGTFRVNNAVRYTSPNYDGLTVGGLYGFSGAAGGFANNRAYSLGALYNNGPIKAALGYTQINNNPGLNSNSSGAVDESQTSSADAPFTAEQQRIFGGGANYTFGPANVGFVVTNTKLSDATGFSADSTPLTAAANATFTNYEVNAHYSLTPALTLGAAYDYTQGKYSSTAASITPKWNQVSLLTDYALSKRTDVYALGTYEHLSGGVAPTSAAAAAVPTAFQGAWSLEGGTSASTNQVVFGVGLRTRF